MARYSSFLGLRVEVQYRAGDILLPASGTFVADSGRSIFLEQSFEMKGSQRLLRWEIPYQYIVRLEQKGESTPDAARAPGAAAAATLETPSSAESRAQDPSSAAASTGGAPAILPLHNRPKTA